MRMAAVFLISLSLAPPLGADQMKPVPTRTYQVPYRLTSTNHVLVRVKINGKGPYHFILDTGAPTLFVSTAVCRKLGIEPDKKGWGTFGQFAIEGGVALDNVRGRVEDPFQLEGMNGLGLAGTELHGVIGYSVLARFQLEFDFTKDKMGWTPLDFDPPMPQGLDGEAVTGMSALGGIMKLLGAVLGKNPEQPILLRGYFGMSLEDGDHAVRVKGVLTGSPADTAGLRPGDAIRQFQGKAVRSVNDIRRLAAKLAPDQFATLQIVRDGQTQILDIKAGKGL
ncbi:MAG TPA: PDZ domain-containing protein [Gemmataceae bacterium]|nr:PDZ domain-containing protein [Gemmataceae bacterium]